MFRITSSGRTDWSIRNEIFERKADVAYFQSSGRIEGLKIIYLYNFLYCCIFCFSIFCKSFKITNQLNTQSRRAKFFQLAWHISPLHDPAEGWYWSPGICWGLTLITSWKVTLITCWTLLKVDLDHLLSSAEGRYGSPTQHCQRVTLITSWTLLKIDINSFLGFLDLAEGWRWSLPGHCCRWHWSPAGLCWRITCWRFIWITCRTLLSVDIDHLLGQRFWAS